MKKSKKKPQPAKSKTKQTAPPPAKKVSRRSFLSQAGSIGAAAVVLGGIGFWGVRTVQAAVAERDLSVVGQGLPTIVQVHDTQCPVCIALQREVRAALEEFDQTALEYRVADIRTDDGIAFASRFGASHSTLLFFDASGNLTRRLVGPNSRAMLATAIQTHLGG